MIKVTIVANIKPLPAYVKRITSSNIAQGDRNDAVQIWPTSRPAISVEPGERLSIALRIRALAPAAITPKLGTGAPDSWKIRREAGDYWLDIPIDAASGSGSYTAPLVVELGQNRSEIRVQLMVTVPVENLIVTPRELDFGDLSLADAKGAAQRVGIRKLVGSFRIKALSSTLPFLRLEPTTIVDGSNYRIRISFDPTRPLKAGPYAGVVVIETDTGQRIEMPVKLKLVAP